MRVTVPVGVPVVLGLTVTVKVTDSSQVDGFADEATEVEVLALAIVSVIGADVLASSLDEPL